MTTLNTCARYVLTALLCGVLTACGGGGDTPAPPPGTPGSTVLTRTSTEASGVNCTNGGTRVEAGIDANSSGTLDTTEISSTSYVCSTPGIPPAPASVVLTTTSAEPSGVNCASGGTRIEAGADANSNGTLDAGEVSTTSYLCSPATRVALPKTGQTTCYDATNALVPCTTPGIPPRQDGALQTGVAAPSPRLAPGSGATADCVTDRLTGLMWPRNADLSGKVLTWQQALDFANNLTLCGFSDWRLPNRNELHSLYIYDPTTDPDASLSNLGFNNIINNTNVFEGFWSSSSYATDPSQAWSMNIQRAASTAGIATFAPKNNPSGARAAWPVRAGHTADTPAKLPATGQLACYDSTDALIFCGGTGQDGDIKAGVPWPSARFTVNSPGTEACLTDNLTGLMWVRAPDAKSVDWFTAMANAGNLTLCGYSDWRLPNVRELESLMHQGIPLNQAANYFQAQGFLGTDAFLSVTGNRYVWSSSSFASGVAWFHDIKSGKLFTFHQKTEPSGGMIWPVRGGQ